MGVPCLHGTPIFLCPTFLRVGRVMWPLEATHFINHRGLTSMVETLLSGIVLGLIPVTLSGLFVTAYLQYRRGDQLNL
jgi:cytochrome b6-f complex subunit 5